MAISPEVRPRVSVTTDYEVPPISATTTEWKTDRMESSSDGSVASALVVFALLVAGFFAYAYYGQNISLPNVTDQSTTIIVPPVVPPVVAPAPSATAPAAPATPPATTTTP